MTFGLDIRYSLSKLAYRDVAQTLAAGSGAGGFMVG
jgi:hypothetical protein